MRTILFCLTVLLTTNIYCASSKEVVQELILNADIQVGGNRPWDIHVHNDKFYDRVMSEGSLGLGESYMDGWWDSERVDLTIYQILNAHLEKHVKWNLKTAWAFLKAKLFNRQSKTGSMEVIDIHYQLGNDFYEQMLDERMTYSCAYWDHCTTLNEAQAAKYDLICRKVGLKPGMHVLDIGCGWGGFAGYAAEHYGVTVVGVTLSENQAAYGRETTKDLTVEIRVQDYRDLNEKFDRIISIGMFEHVGPKNYNTFMEVANRCLKDDGLILLHTIGSNGTHHMGDAWIDKYIFPGGHLPSIAQIGNAIDGRFIMEDWHNLSTNYDKTLMAWHENFNKNWAQFKERYPAQFERMWNYYLLTCAAAFRSRNIQLWQIVLTKEDQAMPAYQTVR